MITCDPTTLLSQAGCLLCLTLPPLEAIQVKLLSNITGQTADSTLLWANAKCLDTCIGPGEREAVRTYLLAKVAGISTDKDFLLAQANCLMCLTQDQLRMIDTWLLTQISGGSTDPAVLMASASCLFNCGMQFDALHLWLLTQYAANSTDATILRDQAKCLFKCLNSLQLKSISTWLLCQIVNGTGSGNLLLGAYAYWSLDEVANPRIDAVSARNLDQGAATSIAGKISNGVNCVPGNLFRNAGFVIDEFSFVGQPFTVSCWVNLSSKLGDYSIVSNAKILSNVGWRIAYRSSDDTYILRIYQAGIVIHPYHPTIGNWDLIIVSNDGVNGLIQVNNLSTETLGMGSSLSTIAHLSVGSDHDGVAPLNGLVDEVGIWNRVLTAGERTLLWNGGAGKAYPFV